MGYTATGFGTPTDGCGGPPPCPVSDLLRQSTLAKNFDYHETAFACILEHLDWLFCILRFPRPGIRSIGTESVPADVEAIRRVRLIHFPGRRLYRRFGHCTARSVFNGRHSVSRLFSKPAKYLAKYLWLMRLGMAGMGGAGPIGKSRQHMAVLVRWIWDTRWPQQMVPSCLDQCLDVWCRLPLFRWIHAI